MRIARNVEVRVWVRTDTGNLLRRKAKRVQAERLPDERHLGRLKLTVHGQLGSGESCYGPCRSIRRGIRRVTSIGC